MRELRIADCGLRIGILLLSTFAFAQESPTPTASGEGSASPTPTASLTSPRSVPLRFVPPPMDGTVSLGIFDSNGKLVRVLHREAKIDSFTIEENSLSTTWDGKNDAGENMPSGKYHARGYMVGQVKIDYAGKVASRPNGLTDHVSVKLVTNPLSNDTRAVTELGVGSDGKGSFLKTIDGLPLASLSGASNTIRVALKKDGEKAADVWQDDGSTVEHLHISNIDRMMAFDCGSFDLK
jgi:FlgD Ig-like domain